MEAAARSSSSSHVRRSKRPRSSTAAQIDVPAVGIEAAAAGSASRRAKRPRSSTTAAQIDVLLLLPAVGIEAAAAGSASRRATKPRRRRRRTAQIGIPSRRAKTVRPHPVSNPPDPNYWVVRRARSPRDLNDSNKHARNWRDWFDLGDGPAGGVRWARSPRNLDDSTTNKLLQPLPSPDYRGAKHARTDLPCHNWRDWANIDDGPAGLIAERILAYDVADYVRFRAVCRPWRQSSTEPRTHSGLDRRFHPWRWTMLREELASPTGRSFLNTSTGECVQVDIPELRDHELLAHTPEGLLVLLHDRKHIRLLNPLNRHLTELPPLTTLVPPKDHRRLLEQNPHFSSDFAAWGSGVADDSTFLLCFSSLCMLGMAKPGDDHWTLLEYDSGGMTTAPLLFAGRFYCVIRNTVMVLETDPDMPRLKVAAKLKNMPVTPMADTMHLINNCGELMLVHRRPLTPRGRCYDTYRVYLDTGTLLPVKSLGGEGRAIFLSMYCSLSVPVEVFPSRSISADTIYLSFDFSERDLLEVGAYHLADGSVELPCSLLERPHTLVDCLSLSNTVVDDS